MPAHTGPAARKAGTRFTGDPRMACMAGGTRTCETSRLKLRNPRRRACHALMGLGGAGVSKPMAAESSTPPAQHFPVGSEDALRPGGDGQCLVDELEGSDANRAAGPVNQFQLRWQE